MKGVRRIGFVFVIILYCLTVFNVQSIFAEDKILQIWDYELDERIEHRSIKIGKTNERFDVKLTPDSLLVESYMWKSSNSNIALIENEKTNNPIIHGVKEGTAKINLEVKTKDGNTYSDETIVSVYTPIGDISGKLRDKATLYRGADNKSWVRTESENKKPSVVIKGSCGNFYYVELPENYKFDDNRSQRLAYVEKNKVDIPATGIKLDTNKLTLKQGGTHQFKATIIPDIATDVTERDIKWRVNIDKASITSSGFLNAWRAGKVVVEVYLINKNIIDQCELTINNQVAENYISPFKLYLKKKDEKRATFLLEKSIGANEHYIEYNINNKWITIFEAYGERFSETELIDINNLDLGKEYSFRGVARLVRFYQDRENDYKVLKTQYSPVVKVKLGAVSPNISKIVAKDKYNLIKWKEPKNCKKFKRFKGKKVKYGLYRKTANGKYKHIKTTSKLECKDSDVKDGKTYYYRVKRKYTKKNSSDYSKEKKVVRLVKKKANNKKKK